jgi:PPP family 3-phenylpropionic acid transporter
MTLFSKLSIFYFVYFSLLGVMAPYLGLYLEEQGFSLFEIAQLSSLLMLTKIVAPMLWGSLADRHQNRIFLVRFGALMTMACYLGFFVAEQFWHYVLIIVLFSFFWNAILPQFEVVTLLSLSGQKDRYSRIRLWGSIGFIVSVVVMGWLFEIVGIYLFPLSLLVIVVAIFFASLFQFNVPEERAVKSAVYTGLWQQLKRRDTQLFFLSCFLLQASHGAYYTYFSIFLESIGYETTQIGWLWGLGVFAEVIIFIFMHHWFARHSIKIIMLISLALTSFRWCLTAYYADVFWVLVSAQCLHAFSFGAMHAAAIKFVDLNFDKGAQGRAQALYSSFSFGFGGAVGAFLSGIIVVNSSYEMIFIVSALMSVLAMILVFPFRSRLNTRLL